MRKTKILLKFLIFIAVFFIAYNPVIADEKNDDLPFCLLCEGDKETYKMEKQFINRIKILKSVMPIKDNRSKDITIALAATVLHKENYYDAIASRYNENFKTSTYKTSVSPFFKQGDITDSFNKEKKIDADSGMMAEQIDLLNAAAIIMSDSAGWTGTYDEKKYHDALAGDKLITSDKVGFFNNVFCGAGFLADGIFSIGNIQYQFLTGQDVITELERTGTRWHNMVNICQNGYIGGIYDIKETDPEKRQAMKNAIADEIINLIHYYKQLAKRKDGECVAAPGSSSGYSSWKQCDPEWKDVTVGGGGTICTIGCAATSTAIQIARSGTQITNLPSGYSSFNPGALVTTMNSNGGFDINGNIHWDKSNVIAPNWHSTHVSAYIKKTDALARVLNKELSEPAEGKYQKFIVLNISHSGSSQHWVAVDTVTDNSVTLFDPGQDGNTLDNNYNNWIVHGYRVMYATDVLQGQTGTSTSTTSSVTPADPATFKNMIRDNFQHGDLPKDKVKYIMMHDTEAETDSADKIVHDWGDGSVAAHFIVSKDGTITQVVPLDKLTYHAGWAPSGSNESFGINQERDEEFKDDGKDHAMNAWSIAIEIIHEHDGSEYPEEQLKALDSLVAYIDNYLGSKPEIIDHKEWTGDSSNTRTGLDGQGKQDVDDSFPLAMYKNARTHDGSMTENYCNDAEGLSTDLGEGEVTDIPLDNLPAFDGGTLPQSGITFDDMETENYASTSWGYDCAVVRNAWKDAGSQSEGYIATLDGRYLVAISVDIAHTGDAVDIVLENGKVIKAILADEKGPERVSMYGHEQNGGVSLVEFEGVPGYRQKVVSAHPDWAGQKVVKIINYGNYFEIKGS